MDNLDKFLASYFIWVVTIVFWVWYILALVGVL